MGDAAGEERALLERELEEQLVEHNGSLVALGEALLQDPGNPELCSLREELVAAVKEVEESLLALKRERLLLRVENLEESSDEPVREKAESDQKKQEQRGFAVGSRCRFRHTDGRWYIGKVLDLCKDGTNARVSFLTPTNEKMQICRFYLQQRCRYGESCRSSHGFKLHLSSLKDAPEMRWEQLQVGSTVLACSSNDGTGLWRDAEVEELIDHLRVACVVFSDDGSRSSVGLENLALGEHAQATDSNSSSSSSMDDSSEGEDEVLPGIGSVWGYQQTETVIFAKWEKHTRGVASKIMAKMGYREGSGLGTSGQGLVTPLQVRVLPPKTSLDDFVSKTSTADKTAIPKKKSRGGKRKRDRKFAEARRKARAEAEAAPDMFDIINFQLSSSSRASNDKKSSKAAATMKPKEDRRDLVRQQEEIKEMASKVAKLEAMAQRNRKEKSVYEAVKRKLEESRRDLSDAEAALKSTTHAIRTKEQEKKWLRF